jgi:hypothetical protein
MTCSPTLEIELRCEFGCGKKERERKEEKPTQLAKEC